MIKRDLRQKLVRYLIISFLVNTLYITGITMLIPIVFLLLFPKGILVFTDELLNPLFLSIALIGLSIFVLLVLRRSLKKTFKELGLMTVIPGIASLLFTIVGKDFIIEILKKYIINFNEVDLLVNYIEATLPKLWVLIGGYIIIGLALLLISKRLRDDAT